MASFISRFNSKKQEPPLGGSRNFSSVGPVKANSAAVHGGNSQSRNNTSTNIHNTQVNYGGASNTGMYLITTEIDVNPKNGKGVKSE